MNNLITLSIRNHNERRKGDFNIADIGTMFPKTRNSTIWGSVDANVVPKELFRNPKFIIPFSSHTLQNGFPLRLSAFFKFQRTPFNAFAECAGMELASFFDCKTSYNCPTKLNIEENSIKDALNKIPEKNELDKVGSLVISMLDENEKLFSFSWLMGKDEPSSDIRYILNSIDHFIDKTYSNLSQQERINKSNEIKTDYCYQYLFRDCFGDVDFTSKNSGIIYNTKTNEASIAPMFDFGETFNILYSSKLAELKLNNIESFPESFKNMPSFVETIEKANALKIEKHNMAPYDLGFLRTFGDESLNNIGYICRNFPNVALNFYQDLNEFNNAQLIKPLVKDASGTFGESLLTDDEEKMTVDYAQGRIDCFSKDLFEGLKMCANEDFINNHPEFFNTSEELPQ